MILLFFAIIPNTVDVDNFLSKLNCLVPSIKLLPPKTKVVYNSTTTIKSYLRNSVTKGYPRQSGVYKVPCSACNKQNIRESDNIDRRLQQHKKKMISATIIETIPSLSIYQNSITLLI